jgi:hypothetical protein
MDGEHVPRDPSNAKAKQAFLALNKLSDPGFDILQSSSQDDISPFLTTTLKVG